MKYLEYFSILLFTVFRKIIGVPMFFVAVWFRGYARNVVYAYKLQNGLWLKRLNEKVVPGQDGSQGYYLLDGGRTREGYVRTSRVISKLEYLLVYWFIWGWLDDDSNYDTCDLGFTKSIISGERTDHWANKYFSNRLKKEALYLFGNRSLFGNTFELGDVRNVAAIPLHKTFLSTLLWVMRNSAYNFKYDQYETTDTDKVFCFTNKRGKHFGWVKEGVVDGKQNYSLRFWEE